MRRDTITCSVSGCDNIHVEEGYNQGHPGWCHVVGIIDDESGEPPHFCPECRNKIIEVLKGIK